MKRRITQQGEARGAEGAGLQEDVRHPLGAGSGFERGPEGELESVREEDGRV